VKKANEEKIEDIDLVRERILVQMR
jgi:hypothetical protein